MSGAAIFCLLIVPGENILAFLSLKVMLNFTIHLKNYKNEMLTAPSINMPASFIDE